MDLNDLQSFIVVARESNIRAAAQTLHQSPSAISKAIRRLEASLGTQLFERVGKGLRLNQSGEHLRQRGLQLLAMFEQTRAEFRGQHQRVHCRLAAPPILQWRFGPQLAKILAADFPGSSVNFSARFEDAALQSLLRDEADFALVTGDVVNAALPASLQALALASITMQLACGRTHPLCDLAAGSGAAVSLDQVLQYDFACPDRSLYCGREQGARADGWRDDQRPRRIRYWLEDLQLLTALVRSGVALAYLPDFALDDPQLVRLQVTDYPHECVEQTYLVWRPQTASGWQQRVVEAMSSR